MALGRTAHPVEECPHRPSPFGALRRYRQLKVLESLPFPHSCFEIHPDRTGKQRDVSTQVDQMAGG